jgi:hypothetical protein
MMQTDVLAAHLNQSGLAKIGRLRLKQITLAGNASQSGKIVFFDCITAPVTTATYGRSGYTVTVSLNAHGLNAGDKIGISYNSSSNVSATDGNYVVATASANSFTITDPNSGTVTNAGTNCQYVTSNNRWVSTYETLAGATGIQQLLIPGEGILCYQGLYIYMAYVGFTTVCYG